MLLVVQIAPDSTTLILITWNHGEFSGCWFLYEFGSHLSLREEGFILYCCLFANLPSFESVLSWWASSLIRNPLHHAEVVQVCGLRSETRVCQGLSPSWDACFVRPASWGSWHQRRIAWEQGRVVGGYCCETAREIMAGQRGWKAGVDSLSDLEISGPGW